MIAKHSLVAAAFLVASTFAQEKEIWDESYINAIFESYDADKDGLLNLKEFVRADDEWELVPLDKETDDWADSEEVGKFLNYCGWKVSPHDLYTYHIYCDNDFDCFTNPM